MIFLLEQLSIVELIKQINTFRICKTSYIITLIFNKYFSSIGNTRNPSSRWNIKSHGSNKTEVTDVQFTIQFCDGLCEKSIPK